MNSDCRARTVLSTGRKSQDDMVLFGTQSGRAVRDHVHQALVQISGPSSCTTIFKYLLSALQKFLGGSSILESSLRSDAAV